MGEVIEETQNIFVHNPNEGYWHLKVTNSILDHHDI